MMEINSRVAVVTGTSRGVGQVLAEYLLDAGYTVYGMSRSDSPIQNDKFVDFRDIN